MSTPFHSDVATPETLRESVAAVKEALEDMEAGDSGRPAGDIIDELRKRYSLSP